MEQDTRLLEKQQRWEMEAVRQGVARFRANQEAAEAAGRVAETKPGQRMMQAIMPNLVEAIEAARREAMEGFGGGARNPSPWWMPMLCLDAHRMAYIAIRTAISQIQGETEARRVAVTISQQVEDQRRLDLFKEHESARERRQREEGVDRPENVYKLMKTYARQINPRTLKRWEQKVKDFDVDRWDAERHHHFGLKLVALLVAEGGGWFQIRNIQRRTGRHRTSLKTLKLFELTPEAQAFMRDQKEIEEVCRPWLVPMLCRPNPWRRV